MAKDDVEQRLKESNNMVEQSEVDKVITYRYILFHSHSEQFGNATILFSLICVCICDGALAYVCMCLRVRACACVCVHVITCACVHACVSAFLVLMGLEKLEY